MIKVKNLFSPVEDDDGQRIWVEPFGLTLDLREWCKVDLVLPHLGPSLDLWQWFDEHPQGYKEYFAPRYLYELAVSPYCPTLYTLAKKSRQDNFTLVHSSFNTKTSAHTLRRFLRDLRDHLQERE